MATRYPSDGRNARTPRLLVPGDKVKFHGDRLWWTVKAVTEHFAALTRQAQFRQRGTLCYTVIDWRTGVRGACDLVGQGWGNGTYTEQECADMLDAFENERMPFGRLEVSQRNWVPLRFEGEPNTYRGW